MSASETCREAAQEIVAKLPADLHHVTVESLLPLVTVVMAHAQSLEQLSGPDKKQLVINCLDLLVARMPFPENQIIAPVVDAIAPAAIDGIVRGTRSARQHGGQLLAARQRPGVGLGIQLRNRLRQTPPRSSSTAVPSFARNIPPTAVLRTRAFA